MVATTSRHESVGTWGHTLGSRLVTGRHVASAAGPEVKHALIQGASRGLGLEIATQLLQRPDHKCAFTFHHHRLSTVNVAAALPAISALLQALHQNILLIRGFELRIDAVEVYASFQNLKGKALDRWQVLTDEVWDACRVIATCRTPSTASNLQVRTVHSLSMVRL